jgi:hypothetical protein
VSSSSTPGRSRLGLGGAEPTGRVHRHVHQPVRRYRRISPPPPLFLPPQLNERLWHLAFNQLPKVNEQLVTGREEIFFGAEFDASAGTNKLPNDAVRYYIDTLASDPDHPRGSFGFYRAIPTSVAQNEQRKTRRLTLPVLAIGGAESSGEGVGNTM